MKIELEKDNKSKDSKDSKEAKPSKDHNKDKKKSTGPVGPSQSLTVVKRRVSASPDFSGVVRIVGRDMDGHLYLFEALRRVKGIGHTLANALTIAIQRDLSLNPKTLVGDLTEEQMNKVEDLIKSPAAHGVPLFMLNRQKDFDSGENKHLLGTDLIFQQKQDIQREKDTRSWVGWRHSIGQKVRGQHTRTTGRSGMTMGVVRKALAPASAGKPAESKDKK